MQILVAISDLYWIPVLVLFKRDCHWKYSQKLGNRNLHMDEGDPFTGLWIPGSSVVATNWSSVLFNPFCFIWNSKIGTKNVKSCAAGELPIVHLRSLMYVVYSSKYIEFILLMASDKGMQITGKGGLKSQMTYIFLDS